MVITVSERSAKKKTFVVFICILAANGDILNNRRDGIAAARRVAVLSRKKKRCIYTSIFCNHDHDERCCGVGGNE